MKKILLPVLAFCLVSCAVLDLTYSGKREFNSGLRSLSYQIERGMRSEQKIKVAVMPFIDINGNVSDFGKYLADKLSDELFSTDKFNVVERLLISKVIEENALTPATLVASNSITEIGKVLKVDAMILGAYTILEDSVNLRARVFDVKTASVSAIAGTELIIDEDIIKLLKIEKKPIGRWTNESEKVKREQFDIHVHNALEKIRDASNIDDTVIQAALYKAALSEIEMALLIYPDNVEARKMKQRLEQTFDIQNLKKGF